MKQFSPERNDEEEGEGDEMRQEKGKEERKKRKKIRKLCTSPVLISVTHFLKGTVF